MKATIEDLRAAIARERDYQDAKRGTPQDNPHSLAGWLLIAEGELDEAIEAWRRGKGDTEAKAELLQMVAVGWAYMEQEPPVRYPAGYPAPARSLAEWIGTIKACQISEAWRALYVLDEERARVTFLFAIENGMAALLQHGIVERHELEAPQVKCPVCNKPSFSSRWMCDECRQASIEAET